MIRQVLVRLSDLLYWAFALLWIGGVFASLTLWLNKQSNLVFSPAELPIAVLALLLVAILASWVTEFLFPLRAMAEPQWIYKYRPMKSLRAFDKDSWIQLALFTLFGSLLGATVDCLLIGAVITAGIRLLFGFRVKVALPPLLRAGRTRLISSALWSVPDSELISDGLAANWREQKTQDNHSPTSSIWKLFFRRAFRRSYLFAIGLIQLLLIVVLVRFWPGFTVIFLVSWGILGAGFYRCADFRRIGINTCWPHIVLVVHSFVSVLVVIFLLDPTNLLMASVSAFLATFQIGYRRAQPRIRENLSGQDFDTGIGIIIPQDVLMYHLFGLCLGIFLGFVCWWFL